MQWRPQLRWPQQQCWPSRARCNLQNRALAPIGLPIYTSDGEHLGEVLQVISYGDKPALRAEIGSFLGLGTTTAVIPANMFDRKADRIELTMTAAEVRDTVAKQK